MELRQLTYFAKTAELRSLTKAAAALHLTQPSLSRQIAALERELDCTLFVRTARGVGLTPEGSALARHLPVLFAQMQRIPEILRVAHDHQELIRVGIPQGLPHPWALAVLRTVEAEVPEARLSLHEATTEEQRQQLQRGLLDLGLLHVEAPELHTRWLFTQRMGLAMPATSPYASRPDLTFADLDQWTVMAHAAGELDVEAGRLQRASADAGVRTHWVFRRFSEHSGLIARTAGVDAVLSTEASARRHLAEWAWVPLADDREREPSPAHLRTWVAWAAPLTRAASAVVECFEAGPVP